jgi:hypothetical protein
MDAKVLRLFVFLCLAASPLHAQEVARKPIAELISTLEKDSSKVVELVKLTERDFGLRRELWTKWLDGTTDEQLAKIGERRNREKELNAQWQKFSQAYSGRAFRGFGEEPKDEKKEKEDQILLTESPEAVSFGNFRSGIGAIGSDRAKAAKILRETHLKWPLMQNAGVANELAVLLDKMAGEDKAWVEPNNIDKLSDKEKINYHVHHLRGVVAYQFSQPGTCSVLSPTGYFADPDKKRKLNAAQELHKIGKDAIPALIELLDDRRPIPSIGYWRNFSPTFTVLRYQDAAVEILNDLLPAQFYRTSHSAAYLSNESPNLRYAVIKRIRDWHIQGQGKSNVEKLWIGVRLKPGIYPSITLLRALSDDPGQKKEVLKELEAMHQTLHKYYRPAIV